MKLTKDDLYCPQDDGEMVNLKNDVSNDAYFVPLDKLCEVVKLLKSGAYHCSPGSDYVVTVPLINDLFDEVLE